MGDGGTPVVERTLVAATDIAWVDAAVVEGQRFARRGGWQLTLHQPGVAQIGFSHPVIPATLAAKLASLDRAGTAIDAGIAVIIDDVVVIDDANIVVDIRALVAIEAPAVPGAEALERGQGYPAEVAEADTYAAKAKPSHHGRTPPGAADAGSGIPAPAGVLIKPTAVVEGCPAELVVTDPAPAVVIKPCPAALAVGGPADCDAWLPDAAIRRRVDPGAMVVKFLAADHIVGEVLAAPGAVEFAVAA